MNFTFSSKTCFCKIFNIKLLGCWVGYCPEKDHLAKNLYTFESPLRIRCDVRIICCSVFNSSGVVLADSKLYSTKTYWEDNDSHSFCRKVLFFGAIWHCFKIANIKSFMVVFFEIPVTHFFLSATQIGISALAISDDELTGVGVCGCDDGADKLLALVFVNIFWCWSVPIPDFVIYQDKNSLKNLILLLKFKI